jgi:hypothetical protein
LERANLTSARLEGATSARRSQIRELERCHGVRPSSQIFAARKDLSQAQLDQVIGNAGTLLPDYPAPDTGEPYRVWTCWTLARPMER